MTKKEQFLMLVQTIVIVRDIAEGHRQAASILGYAFEESEEAVSERIERNEGNVSDAAQEFVRETIGE